MERLRSKNTKRQRNDYQEKYSRIDLDLVYKLCLLGFTDKRLAYTLDVTEGTVHLWREKFTEFREAMDRGRYKADAEVASCLYQAAVGYWYTDNVMGKQGLRVVKKYSKPDPEAARKWLAIRQSEMWSEKKETTVNHSVEYKKVEQVDLSQISTERKDAAADILNDLINDQQRPENN